MACPCDMISRLHETSLLFPLPYDISLLATISFCSNYDQRQEAHVMSLKYSRRKVSTLSTFEEAYMSVFFSKDR